MTPLFCLALALLTGAQAQVVKNPVDSIPKQVIKTPVIKTPTDSLPGIKKPILKNPFDNGIRTYSTSEGGSVRGGGGEPVEIEIKRIRTSLSKFLLSPTSKKLEFKSDESRDHYFAEMTRVLTQGAVTLKIIHSAQQDRSKELENTYMGNSKKVCKGVYKPEVYDRVYLICESEAFETMGVNKEDRAKSQFYLIHHEYASLGGIERNINEDSDYAISEQIAKLVGFSYESGEVIFDLPINPHETFGHMLSYVPIKAKGVTFVMGSPLTEVGRYDNETQHKVTLTEDFEMLEAPVTQYMFHKVMEFNPSVFHDPEHCPANWDPERGGECSNNPVDSVRFSDICGNLTPAQNRPSDCGQGNSFVKRMNQIGDGCTYRLPTEAEWEFAARAGTTTPYYFGADASMLVAHAWLDEADLDWTKRTGAPPPEFATNSDHGMTHEVGYKWRNGFQLSDMLGNVAQWTFDSDLEGNRVVRGSSFDMQLRDARVARRRVLDATFGKSKGIGFRLVRTCKSVAN